MIESGHQPNYLPWLGFFDKMKKSDIFIICNNVQFEKQGFTNRNKIKTDRGSYWLTVPIVHKGEAIRIDEVEVANDLEKKWSHKHWRTLETFYRKAPYWNDYSDFFEKTYSQKWDKLIDLNMFLIKGIMEFLEIDTPLVLASSLKAQGSGTGLIMNQCKEIGANTHLSGIGGKDYLDINMIEKDGIKVIFQDFKYPVYQQLYGKFIPNLSVVDYLFCTGGK